MSEDRIDVAFGAQLQGLLSGLEAAGGAVRESVEGMKEQLASLTEVGESVMAPFAAITAMLAGGELFKDSIEATANLGVQLEVMSQKTGMEVTELSRLKYAADLSHVSLEELTVGLQRMARGMEQAQKGSGPAADAFHRLNIMVSDAAGHLRPMQDILLQLAGRFATMQDGAGKTAIAMDLFGRSGANLIPFLNQGAEGIAKLEAESDRLGVTMSGADVSAAVAYEEAMKKWHAEVTSAERSLSLGLMPALSSIANAMSDGESKWDGFRVVGEAVGNMLRGVIVASVGVVSALDMIYRVLAIPVSGINAAWANIKADIEAVKLTAQDLFKTIDEAPKPPTNNSGALPAPADTHLLEKLQTQWLAIQEQNRDNFGALKQLELDFWRSKLSLAEAGSKDYLEMRKRIVALEGEIAQSGYEGELETLKAKEEADKNDLAQVVEDRKAELELIRKHYQEASKEVQAGIARVNEATSAMQKATAKTWEQTFDAIPNAFNEAMKGVGKTVFSMRDLFREFFADILKMSIMTATASLRAHVASELAKKEITAASVGQRVALEAWGAVQSVAKSAWAALINIGNYAAQAIAGAWAAISSIPYVGPFLAPVVAAGAGAAVLSLAGGVKSAAGGFDIPAGLNPMTQLHAQEMVLPSELANRIRGMTGDGGGAVHVHLNVQAMDSKSVKQFLVDNHAAVGAAMKKAVKHGVFTSDGA